MKRSKRKFTAAIAAVTSLMMLFGASGVSAALPPGSSDKGGGTYTNPVIWADVPDPDVIRVGDTYWMSSTTMHMNPGVPIMKSKDLVNWETVSYCYQVLGDTNAMKLQTGGNMYTQGTWASSLRYKNGIFYVVVPSPTTNKTYIFQTTDPEKQPWTRYELNARYHDCGLLLDDNGRNWLVYGNNPLYIIELNSTVTGLAPGASSSVILPQINAPDPVTGVTPTGGLAEGAHIQKIDGMYYIFNITWPSGKPRTEVCHRSASLTGPWEAKTIAQESVSGNGPAQGGIVDDGSGNWYGMVFRDSGAVGRAPWLMPITWADGWPMFGQGGSYTNLSRGGAIPVSTDAGIKSVVSSDEFYNNAPKPTYYDSNLTSLPAVIAAPVAATAGIAPLAASAGIDAPAAAAVVGQDIVTNGGFETGDTSSWTYNNTFSDSATIEAVNTVKASGNYSLHVSNRTTTGSGPMQITTGNLVAGGIYNVSFKVYYDYADAPATKTFNLTMRLASATGTSDNNRMQIMDGGTGRKGQWTTITRQYTVPTGVDDSATSFFIETNWVSSPTLASDLFDFYVDDVSVTVVSLPTPPQPANDDLIINGGFEDPDMSAWTHNDTAAVTRTDVQKASGSYGGYVTGRTTTGSGPAQVFSGLPLVKGATYAVSCKVYYDEAAAPGSPASKQFYYDVKGGGSYSSSYNPIRNMVGAVVQKGQWTTLSGNYTIPDDLDLSQQSVFIETVYAGSPSAVTDLFNFYVDDVSMKLVSLPEPPQPQGFSWGGAYLYNGSNLNPAWQWNHNPDNRYWSLTERPGWLRLRTGYVSPGILMAPNTLTQRTFGPQSAAVTAIDVTNMKDGDEAGLSLFTAKYGSIGVKMEGTSKYIVTTLANNWTDTNGNTGDVGAESARTPLSGNKVYLKAEANFLNQTDKGDFYYSLDGRAWTKLGGTLNMTYSTNNHFMGYRFALYDFAKTTAGGYVDFDYYRVSDKLTGAVAPTVLGASMTGQAGIAGTAGTIVSVPVMLDPLPSGNYSEIAASFNIPQSFTVTGVTFSGDVSGKTSWSVGGNQLLIDVTGSGVNFSPASRSLFALISLRLNNIQAANTTLTVSPDYVLVNGDNNVVYNLDGVSAGIGFTATDSGKAYAKKIGYSNSLITHEYGADPFAMVYNGRIYVYMTDDEAQYQLTPDTANSYSACKSIEIISSDDMLNWRDEGKVPVAKDVTGGVTTWATNSWAPAAAHKVINGQEKFFLYFADNAGGIGVLTADSPVGPFTDPIGHALISRSTPNCTSAAVPWLFDPAVLVDEDGKAYLYFGGGIDGLDANNPKSGRCVQLGDDMISIVGTPAQIDAPGLFEDSGIHKYNGIYYYSYCSNFSCSIVATGTIQYMVSNNPLGPFTYMGPVLPGPGGLGSQGGYSGDGGNNHHAIFSYNGGWYIAYHTRQVNIAQRLDQGKTGSRDYRSPSISKLTYKSTGEIIPLVMEMPGVPQIKLLNPYDRVEAETIGWNYGIKTVKINEPGPMVPSVNKAVTQIDNGDWIGNGQVDFGDKGASTFSAYVAGRAGGTIGIHLDTLGGPEIGELNVPAGDGSTYQLIQTNVQKVTGVHDVFFTYTSGSAFPLFDIDYWQFASINTVTVEGYTSLEAVLAKKTLNVNEKTGVTINALDQYGVKTDVMSSPNLSVTVRNPAVASYAGGVLTGLSLGKTALDISYTDSAGNTLETSADIAVGNEIAASASAIYVNGVAIPGFSPSIAAYSVAVPVAPSLNITADLPGEGLSYTVAAPASLPGTAKVTVTSVWGKSATYTLSLSYAVKLGSDQKTVTADIGNTSAADKRVRLIAAAYNADGLLTEIKSTGLITIPANGYVPGVSAALTGDTKEETVKAFIWDDQYAPYSGSFELKKPQFSIFPITFGNGQLNGFVSRGSAALSVTDTTLYTGQSGKALHVAGAGRQTWGGPQFNATQYLQPGVTYEFDVYIKSEGASSSQFNLTAQIDASGQSTQYLWLHNQNISASDGWVKFTGTYTYAAGQTINIYVENSDLNSFYIDAFSILQNGKPV